MVIFDGIQFDNQEQVNAYKNLMKQIASESDYDEVDQELMEVELLENEDEDETSVNQSELVNSSLNSWSDDGDVDFYMEFEPDQELAFE